MASKQDARDRYKVYRAMTVWCKGVRANSGLTLASMQGKHCPELPCYDLCLYDQKEKEKE